MKEANFVTATEVNQFSEDMNELLADPDANAIQSLCCIWESNTHETAESRLQIFYNIGTGYSAIARHKETEFDEKFTGLATLNYRKALAEAYHIEKNGLTLDTPENKTFYIDQKGRLETNLANELMNQGRLLEAIPLFESSIAVGNVHSILGKAECLYRLGEEVLEWNKAFYLYREASRLFKNAISRADEFYEEQKDLVSKNNRHLSFLKWFDSAEKREGLNYPILKSPPTSYKPKDKANKYFEWCAIRNLFINELNSISDDPLVYNENLHLPSFRGAFNNLLESSEELSFHGHYDEMKSDFCYARYITYLGCSQENYTPHFFNSTFDQINTLDYQINDLKANHLKNGFKISYSIFDKIAFFLHRFFNILESSKDYQIDFKRVWLNDGKLREFFKNSDNPHFKALFFLSKDIRQGKNNPDPNDHSFWFDPDTNRLFDIRNAIEHRSFKLVDGGLYRISRKHSYAAIEIEKNREEFDQISQQLEDLYNLKPLNPKQKNSIKLLKERLAKLEEDFKEQQSLSSYSLIIGIEEFERLTLKLLSLAKDALIYLSLSIEHEEQKREPFDGVLIEREVPMN